MEVNNDGSPPRPEGPKTSPEPFKPTSPEHELTSSSTSSPPPRPLRPTSPEHKLNYPSTSSPPSEPPKPTSPESELASSSTRSPQPETPWHTLLPPPDSTPSTPPESPRHTSPPPDLASSSNRRGGRFSSMEVSNEDFQPSPFLSYSFPYAMIRAVVPYAITTNYIDEEHQAESSSQKNEVISSTSPTNWEISIQQKLDRFPRLHRELWCSFSIFRAPRNLKKMEEEAYEPQIISIGPFHRSRDNRLLVSMEAHKWRFLGRFLDRTGHSLQHFINAIGPLVDRARRCYAETTDHINDQEFMEMLLLDSCFILELLYAVTQGFRRRDDPLFSIRAAVLQIRSDMLLLENQIPLFVLERMFEFTAEHEYRCYSVSQLALSFFSWIVNGIINFQETDPNTGNEDEEGLHLLNVLRQSLITSTRPTSSSSRPLDKLPDSYPRPDMLMRCVSSLRDSGVKFEKRTSSKLTDIKFERGILKIPPLLVDDNTKSIFLNLMAFEQCHLQCSDQISSYIVFMDGLINTKRDVAYLQQKGIINHQLGSEEAVAQLFNDLSRGISIDHRDGCHIYALPSELNEYVSRKWPTWRASLKREYFHHPWSTLSIVAAVLIIGLTLTQTLYSILAYHVSS